MLGNSQLQQHIFESLNLKEPVAVAVSGGSDSVALYKLLLQNLPAKQIHVLHFNHKLRENSEIEEDFVKDLAKKNGSPLKVEHWQKEKTGNMQQEAREARYAFFDRYCLENNIKKLYIGHTADDVLENLFMRLGRGSGLTGLVSLKKESLRQGLYVMRPMLNFSKHDLKLYLSEQKQDWCEDESNENEAYLRVRVRKLLNDFEDIGLDKKAMLASYEALLRAENSLENQAQLLFDTYYKKGIFSLTALKTTPLEIQLRLIALMLAHYFPNEMLPRTSKRKALLEKLFKNEKSTLGGVIFTVKDNQILTELEHG